MSGIVGSRLNIRGSGLVGSLGSDGHVLTSSGAGTGAVFEAGGGFAVGDITGATELTDQPAADDEFVLSDAGTLKRINFSHMNQSKNWAWGMNKNPGEIASMGVTTLCPISWSVTDPRDQIDETAHTLTTPETGYYFVWYQVRLVDVNGMAELGASTLKNGGTSGWPSATSNMVLTNASSNAEKNINQNSSVGGAFISSFTADDYITLHVGHYKYDDTGDATFDTSSTWLGCFQLD